MHVEQCLRSVSSTWGLELPSETDNDFDIIFTDQRTENYVFEGSLASPANLTEADRVTNHTMPSINFTVMIGKTK